jgi:HK97 family phage prohead protease
MRDGGDTTSAIAEIIEAKEDEIGLWIRCKLHGTQQAQETRNGVIASPQAYGMSVGWRDVQGGKVPLSDGMGFEYTEMNLKEVTLTLLPAQEERTYRAIGRPRRQGRARSGGGGSLGRAYRSNPRRSLGS